MPTGALVPNDHDDVAAFAARAEELDYDSVWTGELWGRDAFVALTRAAEATDSVDLGTAITNVYGRSPATIAQAGATLDEASDGRARLGLGTSTPKAVEDLHGMAFDNPPRRMHEATELTKLFLDSEGRVVYDGEIFEVADFPSLGRDVPVYAAALGPANRRATGRTADGWLPHNIPFEHLSDAFETIAETAREAGRDPDDIEVAPYVPSAVSDDRAEAIRAARGHIAYYVGSGEGYRKAVAQSFPDGADAVAEAWRDGDRESARAAVTEEMIEGLTVAGTPEEAREQFDAVAALDVIDEPLVVIPDGSPKELVEQTVAALAPEKR
jgi:alkanesulfonate monooxygenase SsuD/methylene tetrahydromethanopterin reductase-like flavin-dependent oxidoreductase (luciferase family)